MNRVIKFRAWVQRISESYMATQGEPDIETLQSFIFHYGDEEKLMQFTGLLDKNGKEIYEGDILKVNTVISHSADLFEHPEEINQEIICQVVFRETIASFDLETIQNDTHLNHWGFYGEDSADIEIVGNIYETPELLTP